uniref:Uncharacterized protein n=1 Tax=Meloidogyne enterolobii TaxID=390850 RepID=A0A6V7VW01_MELEN|nr:unnamed protein product [Meloidogyne enterolobii]
MKKVYRSVFLIIFVNIGGYLFCSLIVEYILVPFFGANQINFLLFLIIPGLIINFASASNAPILFINSNDYKDAYKKEFNFIKNILFKKVGIKQQTKTAVVMLNKSTTNLY